ncbi:TIGR02556 family CRISPR-associated protein [bacterium]|nr:TIGR02556 family CRISPR-associated protein [bacterium]
MIEAIMKIGNFISERDEKEGLLSTLVDNPNTNGKYKSVICIVLAKTEEGYSFKEIDSEEFKEDYLLKYLYKKGSSNGPDLTPTARISGKGVVGTFEGKVLPCLVKIKDEIELSDEEKEEITGIFNAVNDNKEGIETQLDKAAKEIEKGTNAIVTLVIEDAGKRQYVGDLNIFRKVLIGEAKQGYYLKYGKEAKGKNEICSVCQKRQAEVYGFVNTYNFYTVDKPGFVIGGFKQEDAWKNYPVCPECALKLEDGKKYLHERLGFNFYGFRYLLIPVFFNPDAMEEVFDELEYQYHEKEEDKTIKVSLTQKYKRRLTNAENEIFEYISSKQDYLNLNLLFYEEQQGAFRILLYVEDILPSRFKKLFEAKERIDNMEIFKNELSKEGKRLLSFDFSIVRNFFPYVSKTVSYDKYFLEIVNKVFSLKLIDYQFLLRFIMRRVRDKFVNGEPTRLDVLKGLMLLYYLKELSILKRGGEVTMEEDLRKEDSLGIEGFFREHKDFFDLSAKKAVFLEGALCQKLLNIQWRDKGATPFRNRLQGLKMDERLVKRLLPEIQNKLEEYGKNYYRQLETIISEYMVASGSDWKMSMDETSFYFVLGMNLSGLFKTQKEEEEKNEQDNQQE